MLKIGNLKYFRDNPIKFVFREFFINFFENVLNKKIRSGFDKFKNIEVEQMDA